jgi:hypothetical protein
MRAGSRALAAVAIATVLLLGFVGSAAAATYTVTRTDDPIPGPCEPADCSLREALMTANGTTTVDDIVVVPASATPYLIQYEELSLSVTDETEVRGAGANVTVVKGDGKEIVFFISVKATLSGLTITGGEGGIQNNGDLTLRGVSVEGNERAGGGGGIQSNGPLRIESSFLGFNRAKDTSGGAIQANSSVTLLNSTIAWNSSQGNSGINGNSAVTATNSSVVYNTSSGLTGAGINGSPLTIQNSIFAGNKNSAGTLNCFSFMTVVSLGGNVSDTATCDGAASDRANVLPGLGSLALHGGTTPLYDLLPGSPAIDAATQCPPVDQRGVARPQGAACDSGPYEFVPPPPPAAGDKEFFMRVGKKLRLRKNAIWVRLTCPASEVSPPCRGRASVLDPPLVLKGIHTLQTRPLFGRFSIQPGRTKVVPLRKPFGRTSRLPEQAGKWRVSLIVVAKDGAGNEWKYFKKRRALLIRR